VLFVALLNFSLVHFYIIICINNICQAGWTPLMSATSAGRLSIVDVLLDISDSEANIPNITGQYPLHYAASKDRKEARKDSFIIFCI